MISVETMAGQMAKISEAGMTAAEAMQGLRSALHRLLDRYERQRRCSPRYYPRTRRGGTPRGHYRRRRRLPR